MIFKISLKNGVLVGYGIGENVEFKDKTLTIEEFTNEEAYNNRLEELRKAV